MNSGPAPPIPPLIGGGPSFPDFAKATSVGDAEHQVYLAWTELQHTLVRKNRRQVNRIRVYGSQLLGAVR